MQNLMNKDLYDIIAKMVVRVLISEDKLQEEQRGWAWQYFKRDPEGFLRYVQLFPVPSPTDYPPGYVDRLERAVERLRAENAGQKGAIQALNGMVARLQEAPIKEGVQIIFQSSRLIENETPPMGAEW